MWDLCLCYVLIFILKWFIQISILIETLKENLCLRQPYFFLILFKAIGRYLWIRITVKWNKYFSSVYFDHLCLLNPKVPGHYFGNYFKSNVNKIQIGFNGIFVAPLFYDNKTNSFYFKFIRFYCNPMQ